MKAAVYKHFSADGQCLYVGLTAYPKQRMGAHKRKSHWAALVARTEIEWFDDRGKALSAERRAIYDIRPEWNSANNVCAAYEGKTALSLFIKAQTQRTLADWAERFGISRPYLYGLMDGSRSPSPDVAMQIERETAGQVPAASWPNISALLDAADAIRGKGAA